MGLFQRQNPDVHVVYDVALTGADAVTASDALRTLANELLAGKGPDLLVLDGMPIDSYVEKASCSTSPSRSAAGPPRANG